MSSLLATASSRHRFSRHRHSRRAIKRFVYGNGIVHDMTQNDRQLPDTSKDAYGSTRNRPIIPAVM